MFLAGNVTALSLSHAARVTGLGRITITRAIKAKWHSASRKQDGGYEIDAVAPASSERRARSLIPWRRASDANAELRHRVALAEVQLAELKTALDDMRAQRHGKRWRRRAYDRHPRPRCGGGGGFALLDDGGSSSASASEHRFAEQLALNQNSPPAF